MTAKQVQTGCAYIAKINGTLRIVRVNAVAHVQSTHPFGVRTHYNVTDLTNKNQRETTFRSATKFRRPATEAEVRDRKVGAIGRCGSCVNCGIIDATRPEFAAMLKDCANDTEAQTAVKLVWSDLKKSLPCTGEAL